jgi:phosphoribosylamine-glycine ligase
MALASAPTENRSELAVVTAPYGTGAHYVHELRRHHRRVAAVTQPPDLLPPHYRHALDNNEYDHILYGTGPATIAILRDLGARHVFAGTEIGVQDADEIAEALGLPGNRTATSRLRRHKGAMAAAVASAGLAAPRSLVTSSLQEALDWAADLGGEWVLKPVDSAGSDGVAICSTPGQLATAWRRLHHVTNAMGGGNGVLAVQERLRGEQYVVNSVTLAPNHSYGTPRHLITEVYRDRRVGDEDAPYPVTGPPHLYDRSDLLPLRGPLVATLIAYVEHVLDALDVRHGPVHTELMMTPDRGPVLIEVGCRPMGAYDPVAMRLATGSDHVRDTVAAALTGQMPDREDSPLHVSTVALISPAHCELDDHSLRRMLALPTVTGYVGDLKPGKAVEKTVDLLTSPGRITLISTSQADIEHDYRTIREEIEASSLYRRLPAITGSVW